MFAMKFVLVCLNILWLLRQWQCEWDGRPVLGIDFRALVLCYTEEIKWLRCW